MPSTQKITLEEVSIKISELLNTSQMQQCLLINKYFKPFSNKKNGIKTSFQRKTGLKTIKVPITNAKIRNRKRKKLSEPTTVEPMKVGKIR